MSPGHDEDAVSVHGASKRVGILVNVAGKCVVRLEILEQHLGDLDHAEVSDPGVPRTGFSTRLNGEREVRDDVTVSHGQAGVRERPGHSEEDSSLLATSSLSTMFRMMSLKHVSNGNSSGEAIHVAVRPLNL